jgi:MFS family permease
MPAVSSNRSLLRALSHRNFRLYFAGQLVSLVGTWMQQVALTWLAYDRFGNSAWLLGLVGFCTQIPVFVLGPVAGAVADRVNRHRLILTTQTLSMFQAFLVAFLTLSNLLEVWHLLALSVFLGTVNAFDVTGRQVFLSEMLDDRADLANAIALNSSMFNGARLVGPALAGILINLVGEGMCFLLNGLSYMAVIAALLAMRVRPPEPVPHRKHLLEDLRSGLLYAFRFAPIRSILLLLALTSVVAAPISVLMPVFVSEVLGGDAQTLGIIMAAVGCGALTGAVYLASRRTVLGLGTRIVIGACGLGLAIMAFSFTHHLAVSLPVAYVAGLAMMVQMTSSNTVLQTIVADEMRGRVMSLYAMALMGMMPLGSLLAGGLASAIGTPNTLRLGGLCCLAGGIWFATRLPAIRRVVRPIYRKLGILPAPPLPIEEPPVPAGVEREPASELDPA